MFIQTETTPNPDSLKFLPGRVVLEQGTVDFRAAEHVSGSALAKRLFAIPQIAGVFFGHDFISITKTSNADWVVLKPSILATIMEHFSMGLQAMDGEHNATTIAGQNSTLDMSDPIIQQILELIDTRVRPAVAQDGGDIVFRHFDQGVVYLEMRGACAGCPSSTATLKSGIENMLKHFIPEVTDVQAVA